LFLVWAARWASLLQTAEGRLMCLCKNGEKFYLALLKVLRKPEVWLFLNWEFFSLKTKTILKPPSCLAVTVINAWRAVKCQTLGKSVRSAAEKGASCEGPWAGEPGSWAGLICSDEANLAPDFVTSWERRQECFRLAGIFLARVLGLMVWEPTDMSDAHRDLFGLVGGLPPRGGWRL